MRQLVEFEHPCGARNVLAERHSQRIGIAVRSGSSQNVTQRHKLALAVRYLNTDRAPAGNGGENANVDRSQRVRNVLTQVRDFGNLDTGSQLDLVPRDGRTWHDAGKSGIDTVLGEDSLEILGSALKQLARLPDLITEVQQLDRRQSVSAATWRRDHRTSRLAWFSVLGS
ncbi:hypothetical protein BMS3Bbin02_00327 [bacterium BMS3Bbin02]|nr:hypothetical protein BMS3Bbin02_00327 [bacterium BMS3Bbin02]